MSTGQAARSQVHLRHLVGGRARSYMGEMPHEVMLQVCRALIAVQI